MLNNSQAVPTPNAPEAPGAILARLLLAGRNPNTKRAYGLDLADFARFRDAVSVASALDDLLTRDQAGAYALAVAWRESMQADRKLAAATVARRLATLRSAIALARKLWNHPWSLDVAGPRSLAYRDTRGPGLAGWKALVAAATAAAGRSARGRRDLAMIRLLHDLGLRRGELVSLDVADYEPLEGSLAVLGKGKAESVRLKLPGPSAAALDAWLADRGAAPGPLFTRLGPPAGGRLSGEAVARVLAGLGRAAGLARRPRPHGLRHQAITRLLELGEDVRKVQRFSRHSRIETVVRYDDNRRDEGGTLARRLAED
ncbi:MAG: tyrosine-type recombinase/integrase [Alphaproteobacteria bacterium]